MRSAVESVGGKMLGFYGMLGQEYDAMVITQVPSKTEYMALIAKVMSSGAMLNINTITLFTGDDVVKSTTLAAGEKVSYEPPS